MFENTRQGYDGLLIEIADYVFDEVISSDSAWETARYCLMDSMGCAMLALNYPECTKLLGPWVPNTITDNGVCIPGTPYQLDPIKAAFDITTCIRWLDFNDTWLAAEWGHPSDNIGGILAVADYVHKQHEAIKQYPVTVQIVLEAIIKAYEIQGVLALENSFNRVGLDHVILVKLASVAVIMKLFGATKLQTVDALSQVFVDGQSLRTYRHAPNTGSRKSWAAGDATSRAVRLAMLTLQGEKGYPTALTAPMWGFQEVSFKGEAVQISRSLGSYVIENILFKLAFPAEFHGQTAVECALFLYPDIVDKWEEITHIRIKTQKSAMRIINKTGPLHNYADRDHCIQYMVAAALVTGELTADSYNDKMASNVMINQLRSKMTVEENQQYTKDYFDPEKRAIGNSISIRLKNGDEFFKAIDYPLGHKRRRKEGKPILFEKFEHNLKTRFSAERVHYIQELFEDVDRLESMSVSDFLSVFRI